MTAFDKQMNDLSKNLWKMVREGSVRRKSECRICQNWDRQDSSACLPIRP